MHYGDQHRINPVVRRLAAFAFLALCVETLFSIPYRAVNLATHSPAKSWAAGLLGLLCVALLYAGRHHVFERLQTMPPMPTMLESAGLTLAAGIGIRMLWVLWRHQPLTSDGAGYFNEAVNLAQRHTYGGTYWPPGFPLFLTPFVAVFGAHLWVAVFCGLLLFTVTVLLARRLAFLLTGSRSASALCGWLLALWPGYIGVSGINSKETLIAALLTLTMCLLHFAEELPGARSWPVMVAVGVLVGFTALTQPGFTLFPAVTLVGNLMRSRRLLPTLAGTAIVVVAMYATILPWTYQNYVRYHRFILISTNGGSVFYTANNARANASYSEESQQALPVDPIEADKEGYRLGKKWVREHPLAFAALAIRKQVVLLGDDGIGFYETLRRNPVGSAAVYSGLKAISSAYWLALWVVLLCCFRPLFHAGNWAGWWTLTFLPFLYQWLIDSVFESGSRHHMAYVGCVAAMVAVAVHRATRVPEGQAATWKVAPVSPAASRGLAEQ